MVRLTPTSPIFTPYRTQASSHIMFMFQAEKFEQSSFGGCPRVFCHGQPVIPCGRTDTPGLDTVKLFCPNCQDIYGPPSSKYSSVDGESDGVFEELESRVG